MKEKNRNIDILVHILNYCEEIEEANKQFNYSFEEFKSSSIYKNAVSMCFLQIGELVKHLTVDFKKLNKEIEWRKIQGMRNIFAHDYGSIDASIVWMTIEKEVPRLADFCKKTIEYQRIMNQEAQDVDDSDFDLWEE